MAIQARRKALEQMGQAEHAGLLLDRYLAQHDDTHEELKNLYKHACQVGASEVYLHALERWKEHLQRLPHTRLFAAKAISPVAVGLGNESVREVGLTIHRTYGMPFIPGSALKGLCRRGALLLQKEGRLRQEQFHVLFGYSEKTGEAAAGYIVFWDAWYDPSSVQGKPFHRDVVTVHHPNYYSHRGSGSFPTDFDDPNPVPFLVVKPQATFLFAIQAPDEGWGEFTQNLLLWCLQHLGVGAKTNAGYGFFEPISASKPSSPAASTPASQTAMAPQVELWQQVHLSYNKGQRNLQVQRQQEGKSQGASADANRTKSLLASLPPAVREKLLQKGKLLADVEVEVSGNRRTIVRIIPKE